MNKSFSKWKERKHTSAAIKYMKKMATIITPPKQEQKREILKNLEQFFISNFRIIFHGSHFPHFTTLKVKKKKMVAYMESFCTIPFNELFIPSKKRRSR